MSSGQKPQLHLFVLTDEGCVSHPKGLDPGGERGYPGKGNSDPSLDGGDPARCSEKAQMLT